MKLPEPTSIQNSPVSYQVWVQLIKLPDATTTLENIQQIIEQDQGLMVRVLHSANAVHFADRPPVASIGEAIMRLGIQEVIRTVAVMAFRDTTGEGLTIYEIPQERAIMTALITGLFMAHFYESTGLTEEESHTLGLLGSLGFALIQQAVRQHNLALQPYTGPMIKAHLWEQKMLQTNHARFGAAALKACRIPNKLLSPLVNYLNPALSSYPRTSYRLRICLAEAYSIVLPERAEPVDDKWYTDAGLTQEDFAAHYQEVVDTIARYKKLF